MRAYIFPGQGSQFVGMGKTLYDNSAVARTMFEQADDILGFSISDIMFSGTADELIQTKVTQPAIYIHSVIQATIAQIKPDMVAGHSLGEFSALAAIGVFSFEEGLKLVSQRAEAMQHACENTNGAMAAVLGLDDNVVETVCETIPNVVAANYNCPGQLVISGERTAVEQTFTIFKEKGAKRTLLLAVGGAFHSPLMQAAQETLANAIETTHFKKPLCPIYQNVSTTAVTDATVIKNNLLAQLTAPVKWTQSVNQMINDGAMSFTEIGPGTVLQGLVKKINPTVEIINL